MLIKTSILILIPGLLHVLNFVSASPGTIIPTREEQANLLLNVEEVFDQVKLLVKDEVGATDESVVSDVNLLLKRAQYILELFTELALTNLSCKTNKVCAFDFKAKIQKLSKDGMAKLEVCTEIALQAFPMNSERLLSVTNNATDHGQSFLDALGACSRKPGLGVIGCYKNIITNDVVPVKRTLLKAIDAHRHNHLKSIEIRNATNDCIDSTLRKIQEKIESELEHAMKCV